MREQVVIGLDVGTTSTKAGAFLPDGSELSTANVETKLHRRAGGAVEQDPQELLDSAFETLARCVAGSGAGPGAVAAIAVTGQMAGLLGIDRDWRPVTPYDSWLDSRCAPQLRRLAREHGDLIVERTGCPPMLDHAPKMQWWRDERPADYERIAAFVMPGVYVAGVLAGLSCADAFIDRTYLHFTGVADARTATWSAELIAALDLDGDKLPRIVAPQEIVGRLTPEASARCGLPAGMPIAAGLGDTAAGALGAGIVAPGQLLDTAGTAAVLIGAVDAFSADPAHELIVMAGVLPGQWLPLNYVAGAGLCLPWLSRIAGGGTGDVTGMLGRLLEEAAEVAPGADGLTFVPHLEGRIAPHAPHMRGGFLGLSLAHDRGHLARAILEAVAFEYATYLRAMRRLHPGVGFSSARIIGGGGRSGLWNSIKADVLGVPVARITMEETATRGAALLAGAAAGLVDDLAAVAGSAPTADVVEPDSGRHEQYAALVDNYEGIRRCCSNARTSSLRSKGTWSDDLDAHLPDRRRPCGVRARHEHPPPHRRRRDGGDRRRRPDARPGGRRRCRRSALRDARGGDRRGAVRRGRDRHADLHPSRSGGRGAEAGKHVFCEKPMAITERECDEMAEAAERAGVVLQIGFMRRFQPEFVEARRAHRGGRDRRPDGDQVADSRARAAAALGVGPEDLQRHARRGQLARLRLRALARWAATSCASTPRRRTSRARTAASTSRTSTTTPS